MASNKETIAPEIEKLFDGMKKFHEKYFSPSSPHRTLYNELVVEGQSPKIILISCADSRVDPSMIFNCRPGDLFVVRNVANLIPPYQADRSYHGTSAALEFAVNVLEVKHIIILGHSQCGGIKSLFTTPKILEKKTHSFITSWMKLARPAYQKVVEKYHAEPLETQTTACEQYSLIHSLNNLKTFPWIHKKIINKKVQVHGWYFDLATGSTHIYDQQKKHWHTE